MEFKDLEENLINTDEYDIFSYYGFELAPYSSLLSMIQTINPTGGRNTRDAIAFSLDILIKLNQVISSNDYHWHFVNIILTDGDDLGSNTTLDDLSIIMGAFERINSTGTLKFIFIGVEFNINNYANELVNISNLAGENSELKIIESSQIEDVFQKLKIDQGKLNSKKHIGSLNGRNVVLARPKAVRKWSKNDWNVEIQICHEIQKVRYCVLFTLDISESMKGIRWNKVSNSICQFMKNLGSEDIVGAVVFNDNAKLLLNSNLDYMKIKEENRLHPKFKFEPIHPTKINSDNHSVFDVLKPCIKIFFVLLMAIIIIILILYLII